MSKKNLIAVLSLLLIFGMASFALAEDGSSKALGMGILFGAVAIGCGSQGRILGKYGSG